MTRPASQISVSFVLVLAFDQSDVDARLFSLSCGESPTRSLEAGCQSIPPRLQNLSDSKTPASAGASALVMPDDF